MSKGIFWAEIEDVACKLEDKFASWKGKREICKRVQDYARKVF